MKSLGSRIVQGALHATGAAFTWALLFGGLFGSSFGSFVGIVMLAGYCVLITSWFVLPMGAILGSLMPRIVRGCTPPVAFRRGAAAGICCGLVADLLAVTIQEWHVLSGAAKINDWEAWRLAVLRAIIIYALSMCAVCAVWCGIWARRWSAKAAAGR